MSLICTSRDRMPRSQGVILNFHADHAKAVKICEGALLLRTTMFEQGER